MSDEKPNHYQVEPPSPPHEAGSPPRPHTIPKGGEADHEARELPLEPVERDAQAPARSSIKELDICPNCGASMRGADTLVCLRCGFDLKTMRVIETVKGETDTPAEGADQGPPLVQPVMMDAWLPGALAAVSGLFLVVCYLAGVRGLFPGVAASVEEIDLAQRFEGVLRLVVLAAMATACGLAALAFLAHLMGMKLVRDVGDLKLAALRMMAIVLVSRLAALINLGNAGLELTAEAVAQAAIFVGLAIALFRLNPRDALTLCGATIILFLLLWVAAHIVVWVTF